MSKTNDVERQITVHRALQLKWQRTDDDCVAAEIALLGELEKVRHLRGVAITGAHKEQVEIDRLTDLLPRQREASE